MQSDQLSFPESAAMSNFSLGEQQKIVKFIVESYNTSHKEGLRAAVSDAAWRGFVAGLEAAKKMNKPKDNFPVWEAM